MNKLITILAAVVLATSLTVSANAQAAGPAGGGVQSTGNQAGGKQGKQNGPVGQKILKQLNLTPDQMKQVKELVTTFAQKRQQLQQGADKGNRKELAGLRKQFFEDLGKILTPEQREQLKTLLAQRGKKGTPPAGSGTATGGTASGTAAGSKGTGGAGGKGGGNQ